MQKLKTCNLSVMSISEMVVSNLFDLITMLNKKHFCTKMEPQGMGKAGGDKRQEEQLPSKEEQNKAYSSVSN